MERELLIHQTAAMAAWLKEQKLDKTLEKFEKALRKELHLKYGDEVQLPTQVNGSWKWVPQERREEESYDDDESGSGESDSSEESSESSSEYETDSDEYETDSEAESDKDSKASSVKETVAKAADADQVRSEPEKADKVDDTTSGIGDLEMSNPKPARRVPGRSVSFDDSTPNEFFYSPVRKSEKPNAFWTKKELRDIKNEEAMERMASIMAGSVFNVPGLSS